MTHTAQDVLWCNPAVPGCRLVINGGRVALRGLVQRVRERSRTYVIEIIEPEHNVENAGWKTYDKKPRLVFFVRKFAAVTGTLDSGVHFETGVGPATLTQTQEAFSKLVEA